MEQNPARQDEAAPRQEGVPYFEKYCKVSNISRTIVGNKIVDHSDVVGASPVGAAPTTSSFIWRQGIRQRQPQDGTRIF